MKTTLLSISAMALAGLSAAFAEDMKFRTVFTDDFASHMTFAEQWVPDKDAPVLSKDGCAVFSGKGRMTRNSGPIDAFRASAMFSVKKGVAGLECGNTKVTVAEGETKRITLDCSKGGFKDKKFYIFADGDATVDDVLVEVPVSDDDSPNLVINSSFEVDADDFPLYINRTRGYRWDNGFNKVINGKNYTFDDWLNAVLVDRKEVHSGKQSLRIIVNSTRGMDIGFQRIGTIKGATGVFSLYAKAKGENMKIKLSFARCNKTFEVGEEWTRYQFVATDLPGESPYGTPAHCFITGDGTVWLDDAQFEILNPAPTQEEIDFGREFATEYRPSASDAIRLFPKPDVRLKGFKVTRPKVKPSLELDKWTEGCATYDEFYYNGKPAINKTQVWFAIDDDFLYVGIRAWGEMPIFPKEGEKQCHDGGIWGATNSSVELFVDPDQLCRNMGYYHYFWCFLGDADISPDQGMTYDSAWKHEQKINEKEGATDYFAAVPLKEFASSDMKDSWPIFVGRNDAGSRQCCSMCPTPTSGFHMFKNYPLMEVPKDIVAKYRLPPKAKVAEKWPKIMGRFNYYMNETNAQFRITYQDGTVKEESVRILDMPVGTHEVTVAGEKQQIVKKAYRKGASQINQWAHCVWFDGRPILPVAPFPNDFCFVRDARTFSDYLGFTLWCKRNGIRYNHILVPSMSRDKSGNAELFASFGFGWQYLKTLEREGIPTLLWTNPESWGLTKEKIADSEWPKCAMMFNSLKNIIAVQVADETELSGRPSDVQRDYITAAREYFPYQPVFMNYTTLGIGTRYADLNCDILMLDAYQTAGEEGTSEKCIDQTDIMCASDRYIEKGVPSWYFLVGANTPNHYKEPSYANQISQCWGHICAGGSGISWFYGEPATPGNWKAMKQVAKEMGELETILVSDELVEKVTHSAEPKKIRVRTCKEGDRVIIATCNISRTPYDNIEFTVPKSLPQNGKIKVLWENRELELKDGIFTDSYAPESRHVYEFVK